MRSDADRLVDIAEAIASIQRYAVKGRDAFLSDELVQTWMVHHLEIIGEALRSMTEPFRSRFAQSLDWSGWIGLRTVLAHHYFRIDPGVVWQTVERDVPKLKEAVERIRAELSAS